MSNMGFCPDPTPQPGDEGYDEYISRRTSEALASTGKPEQTTVLNPERPIRLDFAYADRRLPGQPDTVRMARCCPDPQLTTEKPSLGGGLKHVVLVCENCETEHGRFIWRI